MLAMFEVEPIAVSSVPQRRSRMFRTTAALLAGLIVLAFLTVVSTEWRSKQVLGEVTVEGLHLLTREEVVELIALERDTAKVLLKDVELRNIRSRLLEHPGIADAGVSFDREGSVLVRVAERNPVGVVVYPGRALQYVDSTASCFEYRPSTAVDVPLVFVNDLGNSSELKNAVSVLSALQQHNIEHAVSELHAGESGYVVQLTNSRALVKLGSIEAIDKRVHALSEFLHSQESGSLQAMSRIDVRWDNMVFVTQR